MNVWVRLVNIIITNLFFVTVALATQYDMPPIGDEIVGRNYTITVQSGNSLTTIRRDNEVSYDELLAANPNINFYNLKVGQQILIPKQFILPKIRRGIVINVPELRMYYFDPDGHHLHTFPVGLGRPDWRTPLFSAKVRRKQADPVWHVPVQIHDYVLEKTGEDLPETVGPGPKNPLGKYALYLTIDGYLIHGTNAPNSVGTFISSGCMRLLREPIQMLYDDVRVGTPVNVIHYPSKAGWLGNKLYLESHKPINPYATIRNSYLNADAEAAIYEAIHLRPAKIDWDAVSRNVHQNTGVPEVIGYSFGINR